MIATFYSYKGGSGRTLALANIAVLLAAKGHRVLAVDFDLEAPGLSDYYRPEAHVVDLDAQAGLVDMFSEVMSDPRTPPDWRSYVTPISVYGSGTLSLITSGRKDDAYPERVLNMDWERFFGLHNGGQFLEAMRDQWREDFDFVLIDSRTGITDSGGICTIQLPDVVVAVFTASEQSIRGVIDVIERAQRGRQLLAYDRPRLSVVPLPSRIELQTEHELTKQWQRRFAAEFERYYQSWVPAKVPIRRLLEYTTLPYIPFFSYGEPLPVLSDTTTAPGSLGFALNAVAELLEGRLSNAARIVLGDQALAGPAIVGGTLPPRNPYFSGRQETLARVRDELESVESAGLVVLQGLGGVGKTQVVAEYAYRYGIEYDLIWWVPAGSETAVRSSLTMLASRLGVAATPDIQNKIYAVHDILRQGRIHPRWLLIFDAVTDPEIVRRYIPPGDGHVLITTRDRSWITIAPLVEVDVFAPEESIEFLRSRWTELSDDQALTLGELLGHLPLALAQTVAMHQESGITLPDYLSLFETDAPRVLSEGTLASYPVSLAKTLRLALADLSHKNPVAAQLLQLCAFFGHSPISIPLLRHGRAAALPQPLKDEMQDEASIRRAVQDIGRYGLGQIDARNDQITLHSLSCLILRDELSIEDQVLFQQLAHQILALADPGTPDRPENWPGHAQITAHVLSAGLLESSDRAVRQVVLDQIRYHYVTGDALESRNLGLQVVESWRERFGPDDRMTLLACLHLGNAHRTLGEYKAARDLTLDTKTRMRAVFPPDDDAILRIYGAIGADLRIAGQFREAMAVDERNLVHHERILGGNDTISLRAANNLAVDRRLVGDYEHALEIDKRVLQLRAEVLGMDSPETLASVCGIVRCYIAMGNYAEGARIQAQHFGWFNRTLPPGHPFVILLHRHEAILLRRLGDYAGAVGQSESTLQLAREHLRPTHELQLATMTTAMNAFRSSGMLDRAAELGEKALAGYSAEFDEGHPFTAACEVNLAIVYRRLGHPEQAWELDKRALAASEARLGPDHTLTLCCASNIVNDLIALGRQQGGPPSADVVERSRRTRLPGHHDTLAVESNLALELIERGDPGGGALREDVLRRMRQVLGPEHPETIAVMQGLRLDVDIEVPAL